LRGIGESRRLKDDLLDEIQDLKRNHEAEMNKMLSEFRSRFAHFSEDLQQDYFDRQTDSFRFQKEITLLQRDKLNMEDDIGRGLVSLAEIENKLYGRELFNLEATDENVENISELNLRPEARLSMSHMGTIH
jgi:hypothetical protein